MSNSQIITITRHKYANMFHTRPINCPDCDRPNGPGDLAKRDAAPRIHEIVRRTADSTYVDRSRSSKFA